MMPRVDRSLYLLAELPELKEFCSHRPSKAPMQVSVLGRKLMSPFPSPFCLPCTERFFIRYATACGICGEPILPLEQVCGRLAHRPAQPYAHLQLGCCELAECCIGYWGLGEVILMTAIFDRTASVRTYVDRRIELCRS